MSRRNGFLCWTFVAIFCVGFVILFVFIIGIAIDMRAPAFSVLDFRLSGLDETVTSESFQILTDGTFAIEARNRARGMDIYYDTFKVSVRTQRGGIELGTGTVPGFHQKRRNTTTISGNLTSASASGRLDVVSRDGLLEARNQRKLQLLIVVKSKARYEGKFHPSGTKFKAEVDCKIDIDPQITNGTQVFWKGCDLKYFGCYGSADACDTTRRK